MHVFGRPHMLWLLAFYPLLVAWVVRGWRRRRSDWSALGQGGRLRREGGGGWLAAVLCLILALAQPRWGRGSLPDLPPGHDVVFLVDTSRSMGAEDAVPNRLGVAVEAAESVLGALGREAGNRVAVAAFAGRGRLRSPLTENLAAAGEALRELRPGDVQPGGTDLGAGLEAALEAFDDQDHSEGRTILLFSDGEDHAGRWEAIAEQVREAGVVVHSVGIGDPESGHAVPSGRGSDALTYRGRPVLSKREDRPFAALASATGGAVVPLGLAAADLGGLYRDRIAPVARRRREEIRPSERTERFPLFIASALGFGLWGSWPSRGRGYGFRRGFGYRRWLLPLGVLAGLGAGRGEDSSVEVVANGREAYAASRFPEALAAFERAIELDPGAAVPRFNAAAALYRLDRYDEALTRYREARERAGAGLRTKIDFAMGNTAMALGDLSAALGHYDDCLGSTARGAELDAVRRDAAVNRRYAEEQARHPSVPPEPQADDSRSPRRPPPSGGEKGDEEGKEGGPSPSADQPGEGNRPPGLPPSNRRGPGGAGGSGPAPPQPGSPEGRLAAAIETIREARSRRLTEAPPPADSQGRDW